MLLGGILNPCVTVVLINAFKFLGLFGVFNNCVELLMLSGVCLPRLWIELAALAEALATAVKERL